MYKRISGIAFALLMTGTLFAQLPRQKVILESATGTW